MEKYDIIKIHGKNYKEMTRQVLESADLAALIGDRDKKITLKPNVLGTFTPEIGAVTHPEIVRAVIEYLQENGFKNITIMEGSWVGDNTSRAYKRLGYYGIADEYGVTLLDTTKDKTVTLDGKGMKITVCRKALETDFMINLPVLKGHCQTNVTCALKNMKGVIPNSEKRRFHTLGLHKPIAHLNTIVHQDFILVDNICGDLTFEEGGRPTVMDNILAFRDPVLCDAYACGVVGYHVGEVPYIGLAERLGVGSADLSKAKMTDLNKLGVKGRAAGRSSAAEGRHAVMLENDAAKQGSDLKPYTDSKSVKSAVPEDNQVATGGRAGELAAYTAPDDACSACYSNLLSALDALDKEGLLKRGLTPIAIGQGYKKTKGDIGVGKCTSCFERTVGGCPPKPEAIRDFLEENWIHY